MSDSSKISLLYVVEALAYITITTLAVFMLKQTGLSNGKVVAITSAAFSLYMFKPVIKRSMDSTQRLTPVFIAAECGIVLALLNIGELLKDNAFTPINILLLMAAIVLCTVILSCAKDIYVTRHISLREQVFVNRANSVIYHMALILGQGLLILFASFLEIRLKRIALAWSYTFTFVAALNLLMLIIILFKFRKKATLLQAAEYSSESLNELFRKNIQKFFPLFFFLLPGICILRIRPLFFIDKMASGGLSLTLFEIGLVQGTIGVIAFAIGHIGGYAAIKRDGRKYARIFGCLWAVPPIMFLGMSHFQPDNLLVISGIVFLNQFCFGAGINLISYIIPFSRRAVSYEGSNHLTIPVVAAAFLPSIVAGYIQDYIGYTNFFIVLSVCSLFFLFYWINHEK